MTMLWAWLLLLGAFDVWSSRSHRLPVGFRRIRRVMGVGQVLFAAGFLLQLPLFERYAAAIMIGFGVFALMSIFWALYEHGNAPTPPGQPLS
jgi:hypothetical protein